MVAQETNASLPGCLCRLPTAFLSCTAPIRGGPGLDDMYPSCASSTSLCRTLRDELGEMCELRHTSAVVQKMQGNGPCRGRKGPSRVGGRGPQHRHQE